ncbi:Phosphoribosylglycinamide formyltransferase [Dehalococcoides mccartyi]|uniref:phosphoribosylglycinamide formyltransferase 1 n=2 Tax=Dehalococcoides mccartyi TaxID=61435 RepID=A0A328EQS7_9CHLR|nr:MULTISPECIES: formyltransferase family protein [Dehalococcoides]AGG06307.1 phosphoribosylglycinamide formyltransferase [Dehalococcoides mccartyi DCMB5]RAL69609.1 Phosphoribosylglycinamide formyltransferase [Dehalococcoides mccartyi]RAL70927.1 Phosphoribosylglycinamide formyltransferase [Dehalococcoides mccartyi]CAI82834.1 probable phosphoribosylglycinamide transformylase [Dehalococcoides mccartyi CBDB1]BAS31717.1 formyl transferase [Dehalococcoides mccartyi IBARAKI]
MFELGWFSTARGKGSRNLLTAVLDSIQKGELKARISFVFCSREPGESAETDAFFELVKNYKIPLVTFSYQKYKTRVNGNDEIPGSILPQWRLDYDREVINRLKEYNPQLCVLAGYMLIMGPEMCSRYNIINLHPATPWGPKGTWKEVIWELMQQKAAETGAMIHLVTPELDRGPVVSYCRFPIQTDSLKPLWDSIAKRTVNDIKTAEGEDNSLFKAIRHQETIRELPLIVRSIKAISEGRVNIRKGQVTDNCGQTIPGYDLSAEIDHLIQGRE